MLKRIQKHPTDGDNFSTSDSNTYYEEDFSTSDESSADEGEAVLQKCLFKQALDSVFKQLEVGLG